MSQSYPSEYTDWKEEETENFRARRDKNGNGWMERDEVQVWMFPPGSDPALNEARHLFYHADDDKVTCVTKVTH